MAFSFLPKVRGGIGIDYQLFSPEVRGTSVAEEVCENYISFFVC